MEIFGVNPKHTLTQNRDTCLRRKHEPSLNEDTLAHRANEPSFELSLIAPINDASIQEGDIT